MSSELCAQTEITSDTTRANAYLRQGISFRESGTYDSARLSFQRAAELFNEFELWEQYFRSKLELGHTYSFEGEADKALKYEKSNLLENIERTGGNNVSHALSLEYIGTYFSDLSNTDSSLHYYKLCLDLREDILPKSHPKLSAIHRQIGTVYLEKGKYRIAEGWIEKAIDLALASPESDHNLPHIYSIYSSNFYQQGLYSQSLKFRQKSLNLEKDVESVDKRGLVAQYNGLGLIHMQMGQYELAIKYIQQSLDLSKETWGPNHYVTAWAINDLGAAKMFAEDYQEAITLMKTALDIQTGYVANDNFRSGALNLNLGEVYLRAGNYEKSLEFSQKAIDILSAIWGEDHRDLLGVYINQGKCYQILGQPEEAIDNFEFALEGLQRTVGKRYPLVATVLKSLSEVYLELGQTDKAQFYIQKSLIACTEDFNDEDLAKNPLPVQSLDNVLMLSILDTKARILKQKGTKDALIHALSAFITADEVVALTRRRAIQYSDKVEFAASAENIYQNALKLAARLYHETNQETYLQNIYHFSRKAKTGTLLDWLAVNDAKNFGDVPDSIVTYERQLKEKFSFVRSQMTQKGLDSLERAELEDEFFSLIQTQDSLEFILEEKFPAYYHLKYDFSVKDLASRRQDFSEDELVIEFFLTDSLYYGFAMTHDSLMLVPIYSRDSLDQMIVTYRQKLSDREFVKDDAKRLYDVLISPLLTPFEGSEIKKLRVVPDGFIGYLPLEVTMRETESQEYKYLLQDYEVVYDYGDNEELSQVSAEEYVISFAPSYRSQDLPQVLDISDQFRDAITPLKWNQKEAEAIKNYLKGEVFLADEATESAFKAQSDFTGVLHMAGHAFVDHSDPLNSRLVFQQHTDSLEDGMLHTFELFNMDLKASMVVLSACNTGFGQIQNGDGILSLAKGFEYAGVPSIVMSHWKVDDRVSSIIIEKFYDYLSQGKTKGAALRQAKLDYIQSATEIESYPYFWGALVVSGNDQPIVGSSNAVLIWGTILFIGLLLILGIYAIRR
ncbi:MAG: CHAT domain-containing tetratricopeptide repeat protein [Cytophagales bacterium]|nr:CHAT domain-containing tetratricopeptide repeat protein [Cytophagales bacterium]